jgi:hypothetical protein
MDLKLGRVGNLFSRLPLRNAAIGGGLASMQLDALLQGSQFAQEQLANRGLIYDPRVDPRVIAAKSYEVSKGQQFGSSYFNAPAKGQMARLQGKEVQWDGQKWVRTNIEDIAQDPFGINASAAPQSLSAGELQQPAGQGEALSFAETDATTGAGDPSYLTDAFKKALITRLFLQGSAQQPANSLSNYAVSSLLESQRELGRSITG